MQENIFLIFLFQIFAGTFYFLNKLFLSLRETSKIEDKKRIWNILASSIYPLGLPFWIIVFYLKGDYIAMFLEVGGIFSMILGIYTSIKGKNNKTHVYEKFCLIITILFIAFGILTSGYVHNGITQLTQLLELLIVIGFLLGTYYLAKQSPKVYFWFIVMNFSCAILMFVQDHLMLFTFQIGSLFYVYLGYTISKNKLIINNQIKE